MEELLAFDLLESLLWIVQRYLSVGRLPWLASWIHEAKGTSTAKFSVDFKLIPCRSDSIAFVWVVSLDMHLGEYTFCEIFLGKVLEVESWYLGEGFVRRYASIRCRLIRAC